MKLEVYKYSSFLFQSTDVLLQDNVSLMGFSNSRAVFALVQPGLNVYSSEHGPFCYNTQFIMAKQILSMALENFVKFAQVAMPDPG